MDTHTSSANGACANVLVKSICLVCHPCWMVKHSSIHTVVQLEVGLQTSKQSTPFFCLSPRAHHLNFHLQISPSIARLIQHVQVPGKTFVSTGMSLRHITVHVFMASRVLISSSMAIVKLSLCGPIMASLNAGLSGSLVLPALWICADPQKAVTGRFSNRLKHGSAHRVMMRCMSQLSALLFLATLAHSWPRQFETTVHPCCLLMVK